jgi:hypothetical protein
MASAASNCLPRRWGQRLRRCLKEKYLAARFPPVPFSQGTSLDWIAFSLHAGASIFVRWSVASLPRSRRNLRAGSLGWGSRTRRHNWDCEPSTCSQPQRKGRPYLSAFAAPFTRCTGLRQEGAAETGAAGLGTSTLHLHASGILRPEKLVGAGPPSAWRAWGQSRRKPGAVFVRSAKALCREEGSPSRVES